MQLDTIIQTLLSAAAFLKKPVQDAARHSLKELFDTACCYLKRKFGEQSDGAKVLALAVEKPESAMRKAVLAEEASAAGIAVDQELASLVQKIAALLPDNVGLPSQRVEVSGRQNKLTIAGRDVINAERIVRRSEIVPDDSHLSPEQRKRIRGLIGGLAAVEDGGETRFAAGHKMLQRKFGVESYALIPRERFSEAVRFLQRCCAVQRHRSKGCRIG